MIKPSLRSLAVGAGLVLGAATPAAAQCCPTCNCAGYLANQSYLVNQGPTYTGPGQFVSQAPDPAPRQFPYVGFVFSGYPYGFHDPYVGAPRRFYHPR